MKIAVLDAYLHAIYSDDQPRGTPLAAVLDAYLHAIYSALGQVRVFEEAVLDAYLHTNSKVPCN